MKKNILIFCCLFLTHSLFAQTVIKTKTNKGKSKKVIVKGDKKNSKKVIIKDNHHNHHNHHDKIIIKSNRDRIVIKRPNRPKKIKKIYNKKRRGYVWIKGHWKWSSIFKTYFWVEGHWIKKRKNHFWVDGYWYQTDGGFFWVKGYWEKRF